MDERQHPRRRNGKAAGAMAPSRSVVRPPPLPVWAPAGAGPVAETYDLVSGRTFRVWCGPDPGPARRPPSRYSIEQVGSPAPLAAFASWSEVQAWCDRTLIALGWTTLPSWEKLAT